MTYGRRVAAVQPREMDGLTLARLERATRWGEPGALAAFVRALWREVEPSRLQWAPYMDTVCDVLQRQIEGDPQVRNLMIMLPPGYAKSLLVSVMAPAWEWLFDASRRKLFFSASDAVNRRDARRCRALLQSPAYQFVLAKICERSGRRPWVFAYDANEVSNFNTSEFGFRQTLTISAGVTGLRGDDIVVDDPIDAKAVLLGTQEAITRRLDEVNVTFDQAIKSRLNNDPDRPSRKTLVMQRLDQNDLVGHVLSMPAAEELPWFKLCLPLRYRSRHPHVCASDPRTVEGELLHPDRETEATANAKAISLGRQAAAQLDMWPVPMAGNMIKRDDLVRWSGADPVAAALLCVELGFFVDPASKAHDDNDFYGAHLWGRTADGSYRLLFRDSRRMTFPEFVAFMNQLRDHWRGVLRARPSFWFVEETANGTPWIQSVGRTFGGIPVIPFSPSRDFDGPDKSKAARFLHFQQAVTSGKVQVPAAGSVSWNVEEVVEQWCAFPRVTHDDDCDPASMMAYRWRDAGSEASVSPVDQVLASMRSGDMLAMLERG